LSDNKIADLTDLSAALTVNTALTSLGLAQNKISSVESLAKALESNSTLTFLK
jgi:Leucine-rich repeat (LRR) protein